MLKLPLCTIALSIYGDVHDVRFSEQYNEEDILQPKPRRKILYVQHFPSGVLESTHNSVEVIVNLPITRRKA